MLNSIANPDLTLLRVFVAVVESGGFAAAQINLNVAQSTISTQMTDLETRLGMRLCNRGRTGFSLTDDGRAVYEAALTLFRSIGQFRTKINDRRGGLAGELRIAFADALLGNRDFKLDQALTRFRARAPEVELDLRTVNPLDIEHGVMDQRFHVGIHTFPSHAPGLVYRKIFSERQTLYCGLNHSFFSLSEAKLKAAQIEAAPYARRTYYGGTLQTGTFRPRNVVASADSMEALALLILSGNLIGHLPTNWAETGPIRDKLRPLKPERFSYDSNFEVVVRTGAEMTTLIHTFLTELYDAYGIAAEKSRNPKRKR